MPGVSVLLPFLNPGMLLKRAINSIIKQSFKDWEMILVNNGSTDDSVFIAKKAVSLDKRIRLVDEPKKGIVFALNKGLDFCSSGLIARMDADDFAFKNRLLLQYEHMQNKRDLDLCSGIVRHVCKNSSFEGYRIYVDWINSIKTYEQICLNRFIESPFAHPSVMFRKESIKKYGYYRDGTFPEDYEMWLRWLEKGAKMSKIDKIILDWHDLPSRLSRVDKRYSQDSFYEVKMQYLDRWLKENNRFYPRIAIWGAGRYARKRAKYLIEKGHDIITYIDIDPKKAGRSDCTFYKNIHGPGQFFIVNLAGKRGAGRFIKDYLNGLSYKEGKDYIMAAGIC